VSARRELFSERYASGHINCTVQIIWPIKMLLEKESVNSNTKTKNKGI
jgi:hypothetical protein